MDLKELTPKSDTVEVTLLHPATMEELQNEDGTPMTITLYAQHSPEYKEVFHAMTDVRLKAMSKSGKTELKAADIEQANLEALCKTTKEWNITFDGKKPELTVANAEAIYKEVFWIKNQLEEGLANSLDFMNG